MLKGREMTKHVSCFIFFFQAEDGIRDVERSRGLGDVYKRQTKNSVYVLQDADEMVHKSLRVNLTPNCSLFRQQGSPDAHVEHLYAGRLEFRIQAFSKKTTFVKSLDLCR